MIIEWERMESDFGDDFWRAPVPGGWLVLYSHFSYQRENNNYGDGSIIAQSEGAGLTFVPDPEHKWGKAATPKAKHKE